MKRLVVTVLLVTGLTMLPVNGSAVAIAGGPGAVKDKVHVVHVKPEGRWRGPCEGWWLGENLTPARWNANPGRGELMMRRLITCVFTEYAPGNSVTALMVADRESSFYPWAVNSSSGCAGLFPHITWTGRANAFLDRWMFPGWPVTACDPRANASVAAKMVAGGGWGPWGM